MGSPAPVFLVPAEQRLSPAFLRARASRDAEGVDGAGRYFVWWARNAIYHGLAGLGIGPGSHVLLPAYICRAAVEPVIALGAEVGFYAVARDCRFDLADIETRIRDHTRALILVHYFGFPQPTDRLRDLCARHGISLVEDCAHVLRGAGDDHEMGRVGDIAVFSWGKFLPVNDGGELVVNHRARAIDVPWEKERLLLTLQTAKDFLDQLLARSSASRLKTLYGWLQAPKRLLRRRREAALIPGDPDQGFDAQMARFPASRLSRWIWAHSDTAAISARRRHNYRLLLDALSGLPAVTPLFPQLPPDVCPWVLPVLIAGIPDAHRRLRERGIPAVSWDGVRHRAVVKGAYPSADFLYENLVFLPVHQSLGADHLELIMERLRELVGREALPRQA